MYNVMPRLWQISVIDDEIGQNEASNALFHPHMLKNVMFKFVLCGCLSMLKPYYDEHILTSLLI